MNFLMTALSLTIIFNLISSSANGTEGGHEDREEENPIELTQSAARNFNIVTEKFEIKNFQIKIPKSSLIFSKDKTQIFEKFKDLYLLHDVILIAKDGQIYTVSWPKSDQAIELVTNGVHFLKTVDLSRDEDDGGGHGH